ncbi:MAG: DUF2963 domain-containing protein [Candidatus Phytoplasma pruni]
MSEYATNGNLMKKTHYYGGCKKIHYIDEFDPQTGELINQTW